MKNKKMANSYFFMKTLDKYGKKKRKKDLRKHIRARERGR